MSDQIAVQEPTLKERVRKVIRTLYKDGHAEGAEIVMDLWDEYQRAIRNEPKPKPLAMRQDGPQIPRDILRATYGGYASARHEDDELHAENIAQNQRKEIQNRINQSVIDRERFERTDGS